MRQVTKLAEDIKVGDWLVEPDGSALDIRRVQYGSDFVIFHFTHLGSIPVAPLKLEKTRMITVMVKE